VKRIVNVSSNDDGTAAKKKRQGASSLVKVDCSYTEGLNSDPIVQFALIYAALIHDCDHHGISNNQLAKEDPVMAARYRNKSLAEQNSFEIAFDLLLSDHFDDLRDYVFATHEDLQRFKQIVVNIVLATGTLAGSMRCLPFTSSILTDPLFRYFTTRYPPDVADNDLSLERQTRWKKAFGSPSSSANKEELVALRATVVLEHLMQASDTIHAMQHWQVYKKWNQRQFKELLQAYSSGQLESDPSTSWYQDELECFDTHIIP